MKALRISGYGAEPEVETIDVPMPAAAEVLLKVGAASFNRLEVKIQSGSMDAFFPVRFPYAIGTDVAGTVEAFGANPGGFEIGDRVVARTAPTVGGAVAQYTIVPIDQLVRVPAGLLFEKAAGAPTAGGTAWQALFEIAGLTAGQTILVHAGAGGVGSFAIQLARAAGARVFATASRDGIAIAERLGADHVIDHTAGAFTQGLSDIDLVLDTIGGDTQARSFEVLRSGGSLVSTVSPPNEALARAHKVRPAFVFHTSAAARLANVIGKVAEDVRVLTDRVIGIEEAPAGFAHQASGRARGKVIVHF
jgi:NADPH:quinone reductase-like Zn-dependent oxidoreductase